MPEGWPGDDWLTLDLPSVQWSIILLEQSQIDSFSEMHYEIFSPNSGKKMYQKTPK